MRGLLMLAASAAILPQAVAPTFEPSSYVTPVLAIVTGLLTVVYNHQREQINKNATDITALQVKLQELQAKEIVPIQAAWREELHQVQNSLTAEVHAVSATMTASIHQLQLSLIQEFASKGELIELRQVVHAMPQRRAGEQGA